MVALLLAFAGSYTPAVVGQRATPPKIRSLVDYLGPMVVIKGRVVELGQLESGHLIPTRVRIEHVYRGPAGLAGTVFIDYSFVGEGSTSLAARPKLLLGEEGIWSLTTRNGGLFVADGRVLGFHLRARRKYDPRYDQVQTVAGSVEELERLALDRQLQLAKEWALSPTPELSAFAVHALAKANLPGTDQYLVGLASNPDLTIAGQVALDEELSASRMNEWRASKRRHDMLRVWASSQLLTEHESRVAYHRISAARDEGNLEFATYLELRKLSAANVGDPMVFRRGSVDVVADIARPSEFRTNVTQQERAAALAWLEEIARGAAGEDLSLRAASHLKSLAEKDPKAAEVVRNLIATLQDQHVRDFLRGK
jgi:hypothetical protein